MFSFPFKDSGRCETWKINSGNSELLDLEPEDLRKKYICEVHFSDTSFMNANKQKLVHDAVPVPYRNSFITIKDKPSQISDKQMLNSGKNFRQEIGGCSQQQRSNHWENDVILDIITPKNTYSKVSLGLHKEKFVGEVNDFTPTTSFGNSTDGYITNDLENFYCPPIKEKCIEPKKGSKRKQLFEEAGASPRKKKIIHLYKQKLQEARRKNRKIHYLKSNLAKLKVHREGIFDFVKAQMTKKRIVKWTPSVRDMALSIYYVSPAEYKCLKKQKIEVPGISTIKKWLNCFDFYPGFSEQIFKRIKSAAAKLSERHKICILSFDELSIKKQLDYNKSKDMIEGFQDLGHLGRTAEMGTHGNLTSLLKKCLEKLSECDLDVKAIVCDQGPTNRSAMKKLGVINDKPYFTHNNKQYYALYDVPHLFKSIRNHLLKHNFLVDGSTISWYDVKQTFYVDIKSETCRALPKLTLTHINPNSWQKMRVKYAVQIFSNSMASAMRAAVKTKELHTPALNTANCIDKLDQIFDALNSTTYERGKKDYLRALSNKNITVAQLLHDAVPWISGWKTDKGKILPCFTGLKNTIRGVLSLFEDLKESGIKYLPTRRLNQDCLENLFAVIRRRCGYERNPSARMLRLNLRAIINYNLKIATEHTNCEDMEHSESDEDFLSSVSSIKPVENFKVDVNPTEISNVTLQNCATKYTAGYVVKKCLEKFKCRECQNRLLGPNSLGHLDALIIYKNYDHLPCHTLYVPSNLASQVFSTCFYLLKDNYQSFWAEYNLLQNLEKVLNSNIDLNYPAWNEHQECVKHSRFFLQLSILLFLFKKTLWKSNEARSETRKKHKENIKTKKSLKKTSSEENKKVCRKDPKLIIASNK